MVENDPPQVALLKQRRGTVKGQLTRLATWITNNVDDASVHGFPYTIGMLRSL